MAEMAKTHSVEGYSKTTNSIAAAVPRSAGTVRAYCETGALHCFRCGWANRADRGETRAVAPLQRLDDPECARRMRERLKGIWFETDEWTRPGLKVSYILPDHSGDLNDELLHLRAS